VEAFPASPAAVDFRVIGADVAQWPWRPAARARNAEPTPWLPEPLAPQLAHEEGEGRVHRQGQH
jgi:flagellar biosynthesis protein FlhG